MGLSLPRHRPHHNRGPVAWTMTAIGDGWSALIIDQLLHRRSARFQDFRIWLWGLPPSTLSARLRYLEEWGVIERRAYQERPPRCDYLLTDMGRSLGPVLHSMRAWGREGMMRHRALVLALRRAAPPGRHISRNDVPFSGLPAEGHPPGGLPAERHPPGGLPAEGLPPGVAGSGPTLQRGSGKPGKPPISGSPPPR